MQLSVHKNPNKRMLSDCFFAALKISRKCGRYVPTDQSKSYAEDQWLFEWFTKASAVCRAGRRGERSRCAVRMTAKGSARPGMACRDRPVEHGP